MESRNIRSAEQRTQTICLLILSTIGIGVALLYLRQVLVPFVLAAFLTMAVTPVLEFMRNRMPRGMAIGVTIGLASFVLVFLGGLVSMGLSEVLAKRQVYEQQVSGLIEAGGEGFGYIQGKLEGVFETKQDSKKGETNADGEPNKTAGDSTDQDPAPSADIIQGLLDSIPAMVRQTISWTVNSGLALLSQGLLVMIFMMFLITGYRSAEESDPDGLRMQIRSRVKEYLRVKIIVSTMTGGATFVILRVLGVDLALVFGLMAFFLNFIPNIGSLVAVLLPLPVILLAPTEDLSVVQKLLAVALPATVQFLVGNVLEPRWMGKSLDLNPIVILMALIFWGVLWGPVGMLLSVPITAVLKMLLERSELTQPVAVLLSENG